MSTDGDSGGAASPLTASQKQGLLEGPEPP